MFGCIPENAMENIFSHLLSPIRNIINREEF